MDELAESPLRKWIPPAAGVMVAGLVSSWVCGAPRTRSLNWTEALVLAGSCVGTIFLACLAAVRIFSVIFPQSPPVKSRTLALQMSAAAVWFAPLNFFLQRQSAMGIAAAAVLAAATATVCAYLPAPSALEMPDETTALRSEQIFGLLNGRPLFLSLFPALCISILAEGAAIATLTDQPTVAAAFSGMFAVLLIRSLNQRSLLYESRAAYDENSNSRGFWLVGLAVIFAIIGLMPYLRSGGGGYSKRHLPGGAPFSGEELRRVRLEETERPADIDGYPGVVLWPKNREYVKLVAPPPAALHDAPVLGEHPITLSIPFDGVYWFFRWPDKHPSRNAHVAHGSPEEFNIRSNDGRPLVMEAHQYLGTRISLHCCRQIQMELQNADHYPGTVSVELIVRNTSLPGKPSLSLGALPVSTMQPGKIYEDRILGDEVLNYPISGAGTLQQFDEFTVVFRLTPDRSLLAARIGIKRFILAPRAP